MVPVVESLAIVALSFSQSAHERDDLLKEWVHPVAFKVSNLSLHDVLELTLDHHSGLLGQIWLLHCHHSVDNERLVDEMVRLHWLPVHFHLAESVDSFFDTLIA